RGGLKRGERFLVHGGSGGIGTTAIQLAALWKAEVYTTARDKVRCARCVELGANEALPYTEVDFAEFWSGQCMDLILDSIGGDYFVKNLSILKDEGRLI